MCGIAGWVDYDGINPVDLPILEAMTNSLTARGPDAAGQAVTSFAALGHRRLSVVDPVGGAQPMVRYKGPNRFIIIYNGELYNTPELRQELASKGYDFQGHSDTEVLLTAYMEWGSSCVKKFNGIFAFAIWDEIKRSLFLARDRIGVKPLFYAEKDQQFIFGSELKALLAHPAIEPVVSRTGLCEVLLLGPARTPGQGIYEGCYELKPGWMMTVTPEGTAKQSYWALQSYEHPDTLSQTVAKVRELLADAVKRQLVADVPVCTLLSGGLDSSALSALASVEYKQQNKGTLSTYSVDYEANEQYFAKTSFQPDSDTPFVQVMANYLKSDHHDVRLKITDLADTLVPALKARDLPGMADIDTSLYLFCQQIRQKATVALSGECADEIFGGYPWFHRADMLSATTFPWANHLDFRLTWFNHEMLDYLKPKQYVAQRYEEALSEVPRFTGDTPEESRRREIFYLSLTRFMPTLLDRKDRMSMAFGLEVRVPFCDHRIVDYVWNVPWSMKYHGQQAKGLLRHAVADLLPKEVLWRKKSPYPKTHHPLYYDIVRKRASLLLEDSQSPLKGIFDIQSLKKIAQSDDQAHQVPWFGQLMSKAQFFAYLIQIDAWLKHYKVRMI